MSEQAIKALLNQPNSNEIRGLRDQFLMILLYDTGARIRELLDLRICDISISKTTTVKVIGKGNKARSVPIMVKTVEHLKNYLRAFYLNEDMYSVTSLFYVLRKGQKQQMSDDNVRKLLKLYGEQAKKVCPEVPNNVHPHLSYYFTINAVLLDSSKIACIIKTNGRVLLGGLYNGKKEQSKASY